MNAELIVKISQAKQQLIQLETLNGKKQFVVPDNINELPKGPIVLETNMVSADKSESLPKKDKKPKKDKQLTSEIEAPVDVGRLDMRVGKIIEIVKHPSADTLYVEKIDCGETELRTVCSGLVKNIPIEELENRMVVILCNLKPAKMRGVTSEAMVMCAVTEDQTEVLDPPANAVPGDLVHCDGYTRQPDVQLSAKKKTFELIAPDLHTNAELIACYKGSPLVVPGKGQLLAQTLKNVKVK